MFDFLKKDTGASIRINEIDELLGKVEIIDIREPFEFRGGSIKTAKNIPMSILLSAPDQFLQKDKKYYLLCQTGSRSRTACRFLEKQGFEVINVSGGIHSYAGVQKG